jgi:hypothetical protein
VLDPARRERHAIDPAVDEVGAERTHRALDPSWCRSMI